MKNLKYFFMAILVTSLFVVQSCAPKEQDIESVKVQIEEQTESFVENFSKGDAKEMTEGYATDAIVFPPNAPEVRGKEGIVKLWQSFIDMGKVDLKLNTVETNVFGNAAVSYHTYLFEVTMKDGMVIKDNGKSLVVYKEQKDGSWLIIYDMWNSSLPLPTGK